MLPNMPLNHATFVLPSDSGNMCSQYLQLCNLLLFFDFSDFSIYSVFWLCRFATLCFLLASCGINTTTWRTVTTELLFLLLPYYLHRLAGIYLSMADFIAAHPPLLFRSFDNLSASKEQCEHFQHSLLARSSALTLKSLSLLFPLICQYVCACMMHRYTFVYPRPCDGSIIYAHKVWKIKRSSFINQLSPLWHGKLHFPSATCGMNFFTPEFMQYTSMYALWLFYDHNPMRGGAVKYLAYKNFITFSKYDFNIF